MSATVETPRLEVLLQGVVPLDEAEAGIAAILDEMREAAPPAPAHLRMRVRGVQAPHPRVAWLRPAFGGALAAALLAAAVLALAKPWDGGEGAVIAQSEAPPLDRLERRALNRPRPAVPPAKRFRPKAAQAIGNGAAVPQAVLPAPSAGDQTEGGGQAPCAPKGRTAQAEQPKLDPPPPDPGTQPPQVPGQQPAPAPQPEPDAGQQPPADPGAQQPPPAQPAPQNGEGATPAPPRSAPNPSRKVVIPPNVNPATPSPSLPTLKTPLFPKRRC